MFVMHLDAPEKVIVEGTLQIGYDFLPGEFFNFRLGRLSIPAWPRLIPAGTTHVHLGADLSDATDLPARVNVGIYNSSPTQVALATIEVRRACDDAIMAIHSVMVPPNEIQQFGNLATVPFAYCEGVVGLISDYPTAYVTVTVDQPSLSYVSVLANNALPSVNSSFLSRP